MRRTRAQPSSRSLAVEALARWQKSDRRADEVLHDLLDNWVLSGRDRAFAVELFYGVLRNLALLDYWIERLKTRSIEATLRDILRVGLYQLFLLKTSAHAALNETVDLAPARARGFVNAILRRAQREETELWDSARRESLGLQMSHPEFLVERWRRQFGDEEVEQLCRWNNTPPPVFARVNTLLLPPSEFENSYPEARSTSHPLFFQLEKPPTEALRRGHCYVQDPSTSIAPELLHPQPGETVLDACAAPGGKTSYLAQLMQNRGSITACDNAEARLRRLQENLERLQVQNVRVQHVDWLSGTSRAILAERFDRILVDAPCSNTGVMRRRVDVRWRLSPETFKIMQNQQIRILETVASLLKKDATLVYSTCSIEPEENKTVVSVVLGNNPQLRLVQEQMLLPFRDGCDGAYAAVLVSA
jgi:16S rRNA (cytosine967-C5)-methyltransferase